MINRVAGSVVLALLWVSWVSVPGGTQETEKKAVQKAPIQPTSPASGKEMFEQYCAVCHGRDAKGNGPAASDLKTPPADLTTLTKRNGGKFPSDKVSTVLRFGVPTKAHGTSDMPTWGPLFRRVSGSDEAQVDMRISNLLHYLETLQQK
jgi:mono/diheme cytochrome c family protein